MTWISADVDDDAVLLVAPDRQWTLREIRAGAAQVRNRAAGTSGTVVVCTDAATTVLAIQGLEGQVDLVTLLPPHSGEHVAQTAASQPAPSCGRQTRWLLLTSGTTGTPRRIGHTMLSLSRTVKSSMRTRELVWGLLYQPSRMAGLQVLVQALGTGTRVVAPSLEWPLRQQVAFLAAHRVNALSATPTRWRQILQLSESDDLDLAQITLGGEIADQRLLDALAARFPRARVTHVFAATESGAAFAVTDGRAGFPIEYLTESPYGIPLRVIDGVLHVYAPDVDGANSQGYVSTGDLVEITTDRVFFLGRDSGAVNVGGAKVMPESVEEILRTHPQVLQARVYARPNSFSGSVLVAEVLPRKPYSPQLAAEIRRWVRGQAPSHFIPAKVLLVDDFNVSATGKTARS